MKLNSAKIILVHPLGYRADAARSDISRLANIMPPLGLTSIAAYLEQRGFSADIIDYYAAPDSDSLLREYLQDQRPAFIGLSCTTSSFLDGIRITRLAKSLLPELQAVFGGPHVSALREKLLEDYPDIDFIVTGEGEAVITALMDGGHEQPDRVPGLLYREKDGTVRFSGYPEKQLELDALPFPAYEKLTGYPHRYKLPIFNYPTTPNSSCVSSRGCPYACSYCDRSVFRRTFRYNSATYLYEHMRYLHERFGIRHLNFYDDQFTFNRARVEELCQLILAHPLGMTFNCAVRSEHIDFELLSLMKAAGCWMASLGIETGDPDLLAQHRQNPDLDMVAEKIRLIKKAGIRTKGLLMMGLPGESPASIQKSMDYVFSLPIDDFNLAKFTPFPGSPLYENIHQLGTFDEKWENMDCMQFCFIPNGMNREQLDKLFIDFYKQHFHRPEVLFGYFSMLWKSPDSWYRFAANLVDFIRFARSNKRHD